MMKDLEIKTSIQILKPVEQVFEAIIDPQQMKNYFISESTGKLESRKMLKWKFPEFDEQIPIEVLDVKENELIPFKWEGSEGRQVLVEIVLDKRDQDHTIVRISEGKMPWDEPGIEWFGRNTEGWANFLACLKAYLEYDINLRKGAFDFMDDKI